MEQSSFLFRHLPEKSRVRAKESAVQPAALWTVRGLVQSVQRGLERDYADVRVEGEICNLRAGGASGHAYFTLREGEAQISVVMFRTRARLLRFALEDGLRVLLRGRVTVYESRGQLQILADTAEPVGEGALRLAYEQLAEKLRAEGLVDRPRRSLPLFPRCVGVITSPQGAVIHDIWQVLSRRYGGSRVLLYPAAVQGENAADELIAGLRWFASHPDAADVVVLARGGGSFEDLHVFNDERLARAIAISPLPVISAIGHETDFTIADLVADLRAPTPSAAAELLTAQQHLVTARVHEFAARLHRAARYRVGLHSQQLARLLASRGLSGMRELTFRRLQRLDDLVYRLAQAQRRPLASAANRVSALQLRLAARDIGQQLRRERLRLQHAETGLSRVVRATVRHNRAALANASAQLAALSPRAVLARGYALVYTQDGALLRSASRAEGNTVVTTQLTDGSFRSRILDSE